VTRIQSTLFGIVKFQTPLGLKLLVLFVSSNFEISAPECCTYYTPDGRGDLDTVVHQNVQLPQVIATDIPDSDLLSILLSILGPVRTREALDPVEELTDWKLFQASPLNSYLQMSKFALIMNLIKQHVTLQAL
jgi:hypothetical protein